MLEPALAALAGAVGAIILPGLRALVLPLLAISLLIWPSASLHIRLLDS